MLMEQAVVFLVYSQDKQVLWPCPQNRGQCHVTSLAVLQRDSGMDKQLPWDASLIVFAEKKQKSEILTIGSRPQRAVRE